MSQTVTLSPTKAWMVSLRLRTLPLALASIVTGSAMAGWQGHFKPVIALMALITAALLQILSNLANDYGDAIKGSDEKGRIGPLRGMQLGIITREQMRVALMAAIFLSLLSGAVLIWIACEKPADILGFLVLGVLSVIAAITYTMGTRPYGYMGLGDLSVLIFFGWLSVGGSYYLQTGAFHSVVMLPATACGLLAAAVLNINNLRDIESDRLNGKNTLAVRLGPTRARYYHVALLTGAVFCLAIFTLLELHNLVGWLFVLTVPALYMQARYVLHETSPSGIRPMLEKTVKCALLINILFAVGLLFS
ncbi:MULTISPECIES: 1,4-dihydroxy-2-naphthoate polyprenyltransferase [Sodalis]|jgi:1,4-dihydroxy-2-naphthoate octaprenyltransferase|uniref:1,4-dihydroxy-2-naphthoate octaprenyltransferase n=1 Tax=Sodalis ligni TaxID=2697027 RepID=A0A4R1NDG4_9GAMM|nr:1,4-dihydroxy-2-naphthoate polyprenyltransferase [Sodalis ligni]TCL05594.1 1,4-dihydroxy-2-naphthoate prenyltransferase [Sodalis ligni]